MAPLGMGKEANEFYADPSEESLSTVELRGRTFEIKVFEREISQ